MLVSPHDHIAFFQADTGSRAVRFHVVHHNAFIFAFVAHLSTFNTIEDGAGVHLILAALLQFQAHVNRLTFTQQTEGDFATNRHGTHFSTQGRKAADRFTVQRSDHITGFNPRFRRRGVRQHLADKCPTLGVHFHCFRQLGVQLSPQDTQLTAFHLAILHHLCGQVFHHITWDSKADTDVTAVRSQDCGVDTNQFTVQVHQRTAGVTPVNRRIRLDKVLVVLCVQAATTQRGDNTRGHGFTQTERVADGYGVVTHTQRVGIGELNRRQVFRILNLDQRDIRTWIFTHHFSVEFTSVAQLNFNGVGVINNVVVGHHVAFCRINNDARTECHEFLLLAATVTALAFIPCTTALTERGALEG